MKKLSTREFRANMGRVIEDREPVVLGDGYRYRAIFIPISSEYHWERDFQKRVKEAKRAALELFKELEALK